MKHLPNIAGGLLGLAFLTFGLNHFLKLLEVGGSGKPSPEVIAFFTATGKSGFMDFVKILEIIGGLLVAIP
jgi:putative oxidoreductase